ncbi:MAG: tRNA uridine-5-carboxymethylaminomethyl(34) synthesis GTPase MnmE [Bacteroidales bacterium]|nr:tRNA uridine-5-carboxymethylaminomethyl(34) synthesis GTPase MnmE [Bacteroidales bacterium]
MINPVFQEDTICAISTAPGVGGIAVIRVSGSEAIAICEKIFTPVKKRKLIVTQETHTLSYGTISKNGETIDDVLLALFHTPHSYTGEDTIEISCHGSIYIQQQIVQLLIEKGCRLAQPGEFTQRAFLNGKMDLSQAEAVADLIASSSAATHKLALNQMKGGFSRELDLLRERLLDFAALIELELDFSEEDVEFADRTNLKKLATEIQKIIQQLADSFSVGNAIKNGIPVAIIGETNAGKSTLLNLLLREDKAIVSDIHGTTRDVIEDTINIGGATFRFIDTAGIRDTTDIIESLGIERTFQKIAQAEIVLWVVDATSSIESVILLAKQILPLTSDKTLLILFNKSDKIGELERVDRNSLFEDMKPLFISAKEKLNTDELQKRLIDAAHLPEISANDVIVTNLRHYEALSKADEAIRRVIDGMENGISADFLAQDIRECMHYLAEITGKISANEILHTIFRRFCIGK